MKRQKIQNVKCMSAFKILNWSEFLLYVITFSEREIVRIIDVANFSRLSLLFEQSKPTNPYILGLKK